MSDDDWKDLIESVKPIKNNKFNQKERSIVEPSPDEVQVNHDSELDELVCVEEVKNTKSFQNRGIVENTKFLPPGDFSKIDGSYAKAFKKGNVKIEAVLDLHGMRSNEAEEEFFSFVVESFSLGFRVLLLISGKGLRSQGNTPILKEKIPNWINSFSILDKILFYNFASKKHGGNGAYYILLKKNKNL